MTHTDKPLRYGSAGDIPTLCLRTACMAGAGIDRGE